MRVRDVETFREVARGHEEGPALDHQPHRRLAHERPVLDAVDARLHGRANSLIAVRVRGDLDSAPVRLVDDRAQLLVGVVLRPG
jgi:hypothetical protein